MKTESYFEHRLPVGDGMSVFYRAFGSPMSRRVPVLCLHGYWRNSRDFEELAPRLAQDRFVITPDLRGRGESDRATKVEHYSFDRLVADMWKVLDHLLVQKVVVLGMTLGGMVALEMASKRPDRVVGLVLNDEGPERPPDWEGKMTALTNYDALTPEEAVAKMRAYANKNYRPMSEEMLVRIARRGYREGRDGKWIRDVDPLTDEAKFIFRRERPEWWAELRATAGMPVEVLRGERSELLKPNIAERMTREHPDLRVHNVMGQGHPPLLDEPEVFAALDTLLARVDAAHAKR